MKLRNRAGRAVLKVTNVLEQGSRRVLTKLRVHHGLLVANRWSRTIMKVCSMLLAAVSAPRV